MPDSHNGVWCEHVDLHQIDECRPTSQKHRTRARGYGLRRIRRASQPFKGEGVHVRTSTFALRATVDKSLDESTCLTAATMFG